ncbi:thiamine-phosphate kinase [Orrella daihaiensis]|uniref:Thiamine-monophosphate kinase n=1 Tax=Orrella daihaiensis TaxID=2782176 RepID=A0ABY4AKJ0_9BURK|nr:thiamine-phosphate kinase [Orrella daihaiensis]UOD50804.1 thiamine-phosphate kinase [Orrella daihaiensis]
MALGEFSLIDRYFKRLASPASMPGMVGVGDDAAILPISPGHKLVVCKDVLVEGRHFFSDVAPDALGHKSLAVNLSDLAAMGAKPIGCLLGLGVPTINETWLASFAAGLGALADRYRCPLIGGDTVASEQGIFISVTALGTLHEKQPGLLRSAAEVGDDIWVSGPLGVPDIALRILLGTLADPQNRLPGLRVGLERPEPRVALGQQLLGVANAAIDISDGLTQDLGHVLQASGVGAVIDLEQLPVDQRLAVFDPSVVRDAVLYGGDVYELCFTVPAQYRPRVIAVGESLGLELFRIGKVRRQPGLFAQTDGSLTELKPKGFDHFARSAR